MIKSKMVGDFKLLREHCIKLRQSYNTYTQLYNEDNRSLLRDVAAAFFSDIAEIMHRDWILQVCKLMDPASTKRKGSVLENITIKLIDEQLEVTCLVTCLNLVKNLNQQETSELHIMTENIRLIILLSV
jgi:hypothetical protein